MTHVNIILNVYECYVYILLHRLHLGPGFGLRYIGYCTVYNISHASK